MVASVQFSSVQSLSHVRLFTTPWTTARQASLSFTNTWSLLRLMSIKLVMPSNHLILCHPILLLPSIFPSIRVFPMSKFFASGGQSIAFSLNKEGPRRLVGTLTTLVPFILLKIFYIFYTFLVLSQELMPLNCDAGEDS